MSNKRNENKIKCNFNKRKNTLGSARIISITKNLKKGGLYGMDVL